MFANGQVDVKNIDGELYINMWQMSEHMLLSALQLKKEGGPDGALVAGVLAVVVQTLADLAIYSLDKEEIDNVDDIVKIWSKIKNI